MDKARTAVWTALTRVQQDAGYSNLVLDKTLRSFQLDQRDSAFASALFYGVLEKRILLDYCIQQFSKIPLKKMENEVMDFLRMGIYQILYMDKVPDSAAVNETVQIAKNQGFVKASGFINGVLRNFLRKKEQVVWPDPKKEPNLARSVCYSCPQDLILLWERAYGKKLCGELLESLLEKPPVYVRVNTVSSSLETVCAALESIGVKSNSITEIPGCLSLWNPGALTEMEAFRNGWFHVQDLSSQICCFLVHPNPGERVLDVCAAPGGKTFTMAEYMQDQGTVLSFDKYKGKVGLIRTGAERLGLHCIQAAVRDAAAPKETLEAADRVLCDVPCSGFGIVRRKPEIRYKSLKDLDSLPNLQYLILCKSSNLVKPGGFLFYSTCTLNPKENGDVASRFLWEHPDFESYPLQLPGNFVRAMEEPENQLTIFPHMCGSDGFFISAFRRKQETL